MRIIGTGFRTNCCWNCGRPIPNVRSGHYCSRKKEGCYLYYNRLYLREKRQGKRRKRPEPPGDTEF